jgi:hypothetical protein
VYRAFVSEDPEVELKRQIEAQTARRRTGRRSLRTQTLADHSRSVARATDEMHMHASIVRCVSVMYYWMNAWRNASFDYETVFLAGVEEGSNESYSGWRILEDGLCVPCNIRNDGMFL